MSIALGEVVATGSAPAAWSSSHPSTLPPSPTNRDQNRTPTVTSPCAPSLHPTRAHPSAHLHPHPWPTRTLTRATRSAVDSFEELNPFAPLPHERDAHSLAFGAALSAITLGANVTLGLIPLGTIVVDGPLEIDFEIMVTLRQLVANATLFAPLNSSVSLADALSQPGCLHAALLGGQIRNLGLALSPEQFVVQGSAPGLAGDLDEFLNALFLFLNAGFATPTRELINGVVGGPLRNLTDRLLH